MECSIKLTTDEIKDLITHDHDDHVAAGPHVLLAGFVVEAA